MILMIVLIQKFIKFNFSEFFFFSFILICDKVFDYPSLFVGQGDIMSGRDVQRKSH